MHKDLKYFKSPFCTIAEWLSSMGCDEVLDKEARKFYGIRKLDEKQSMESPQDRKKITQNNYSLDNFKSIGDLKKFVKNKIINMEKNNLKGFIFNEGNISSDLMVIGDNPETLDINNLKSFQGEVGFLLLAMLKAIDFDDNNTYFTNMFFCPYTKGKKPILEDVLDNVNLVKKQVEIIQPKVIIMFGSITTQSLTGKREGIFTTRGNWYDIEIGNNAKVFPAISMYQPDYLLTRPDKKKEAWADLIEVKKKIDMKK
ncbi:MAG: hypothetical protein CFH32_01451 [Alphaproteobacteria bacterium MarineAlpha9_Bin2]|nr:MAG: hypothetical protein CFH32_01451 [Alphaproteobacteria bacterium MarineAlpha9_Bin2]